MVSNERKGFDMRRFAVVRAVLLGIAGAALASSTAFASTTVVVERTVDLHFDGVALGATTECGFPIEVHTIGSGIVISRYYGDQLVSQTIQFVWDGYFLNPANGHTVDSMVAGPERITYLADGTVIDVATGTTHRNLPGEGLVSGFIGRGYVVLVPTGEVDVDGFPIYDLVDESFTGQWLGNTGMCATLA
jgi:hypothetical protein